ncbi:MAG: mannosyl-glycoprotein endo-beta-N-acetylglucosamidase [Campylobacteraceae bacterium]|jgi:Bax protein|nr:mannosyl-glycoprotein endo-beta-N-acetylglucosamidase [Campylobacteraceae bacterium]MBT4030277.1 mannosyl-glycoprotein endo-beta-N-acetylglucosamidase [Campylobacteraceae bacterium]MBT4179619.1 mannosyl-glycoprotein endo-beta-N-acetylglucosamidase [Campylobacteraceae bacterium]MBT4572990.1 mannosyl-glycoprotein endo-beta-N-acetylglucosamidase [Campylobacteraceae bacterium]MBT4707319.1 mannosyl-glycoprotein endo-beta-N-acetylglucosamidase [Campylobacteraceae bacterium]
MIKKTIMIIFLSSVTLHATGLPNSYYQIKDIKKQKQEFFDILSPMIEKETKKVLRDRAFVKNYFNSGLFGFRHDGLGMIKLMEIKKHYRIKDLYNFEEYLLRVDTIPISIILAQAALESGWGKSRFVKKANNIFGQWTYTGKGLIPKGRKEGQNHKIKIFKSLQSAIKAYLRNINTGWAYKSLRKTRSKLRKDNVKINGLDLYKEYIYYSQIREEYLKRLKKMILQNDLLKYDE